MQALVKTGLPVASKRVVVAGSGPLLLAVAAYLRHQGAQIPLIAEQAAWGRLLRFGLGLSAHPGKLAQALGLRGGCAAWRTAPAAGPWPRTVMSGWLPSR